MQKNYGYARVSTREQNEDRQVAALLAQGIARRDIFVDKQSGKDFERPEYRRLMRRLKRGDTLFIKSIDRLGRNYDEIPEEWRRLTKERGVQIVVLDMPLLDTRQKGRDLTGVFIADLVLQILSYFAQIERDFIRQRQAEGIAAAKAKGARFGRPPKERPRNFPELCEKWQNREVSARAAARELGISHRTFLLWAGESNAEAASAASSAILNV
jgi:DNA invertase Pin-like site-specific DNA recombinase